jgi:hypothetical protein
VRRTLKRFGILLLSAFAILFVLTRPSDNSMISEHDRILRPYKQNVLRWELEHFFDKWWYQAEGFFLKKDHNTVIQADALTSLYTIDTDNKEGSESKHYRYIASKPNDLKSIAEETIESAISKVAKDQKLGSDKIFSVIWPPVDFTFSPRPLVLILSPKDEVQRLEDSLLRNDIDAAAQERLEEQIERSKPHLSALVIPVGGVATYPSQVPPGLSLNDTLNRVAHEWIHHYLFFKPLGRQWFERGVLQSINESVADLAGRELANLASQELAEVGIHSGSLATTNRDSHTIQRTPIFNYRKEMRITRVNLDQLLAAGRLNDASTYLEARRRIFFTNGYYIRKLNTAFFAFHGTYGTSPVSVNPIASQLTVVRANTSNLGEFLDLVSNINSSEDLTVLASQVGWSPGSH